MATPTSVLPDTYSGRVGVCAECIANPEPFDLGVSGVKCNVGGAWVLGGKL